MDLNWLQSLLYGIFSGLADILPVSAEAHRILMLKCFGIQSNTGMMELFAHLGVFGAMYFCCRKQIVRIQRARHLARIPKRRRRRPLDTRSLMDFSLLRTMLIPVILSFFLNRYVEPLEEKLIWIAGFLFLNGIILYIPQFFPTSNRDSRMLSRVEGFLVGLGGALGILPGISAVGSALSVASICGVERSYGLSMALLMNMLIQVGLIVLDVMGLAASGVGTLSFLIFIRYLMTAAVSFGAALLGAKIMRLLAANKGYALLAVYCWGVAMFTFILNLMA